MVSVLYISLAFITYFYCTFSMFIYINMYHRVTVAYTKHVKLEAGEPLYIGYTGL